MKILLLGAGGRLGAALARAWSREHEVFAADRKVCDVADREMLLSELDARPFDVLVNASGLTNVDLCETERDLAQTVNAQAPAWMAQAASDRQARFIHFSTDYVFDGKKTEPYTESDRPAPLSWYGRTKHEGEIAVLSRDSHHLVVRVSWVFGPDKPAFPDMILRRALQEEQVAAISDKFSSPTFTEDVADWLTPFFDRTKPGGLLHAAQSGGCSWQEYGQHALDCASSLGLPLKTSRVDSLRLSEMKQFLAPRPVHTLLSTDRLTAVTGLRPRLWQTALSDYITRHYASFSSPGGSLGLRHP